MKTELVKRKCVGFEIVDKVNDRFVRRCPVCRDEVVVTSSYENYCRSCGSLFGSSKSGKDYDLVERNITSCNAKEINDYLLKTTCGSCNNQTIITQQCFDIARFCSMCGSKFKDMIWEES